MTGRSRKLLFAATFLVVGLGAFLGWKAVSQAEPVYQGRPLTSWVEQWETNHWHSNLAPDEAKKAKQEAAAAINHAGTNGIEFLLGLMRTREPAIKPWLRKTIPTSWHSRLYLEYTAPRLQSLGGLGLTAYGTNGGHAVPELMVLLSIEMTRKPSDQIDGYVPVWVLGNLGSAADPAVPLMVQCLTNHDRTMRNEAASSLGRLHRKPEIAVPALLACLKRDGVDVTRAIESIGLFGTDAIAAAPTLVALLDDPDPDVRTAVTNWLPRIDRAAAERAGIPPWER